VCRRSVWDKGDGISQNVSHSEGRIRSVLNLVVAGGRAEVDGAPGEAQAALNAQPRQSDGGPTRV
jgi:hypothetical protein